MKLDKFGVPLAFLVVIIIWSTTPLAIKWSSVSAPLTSALLRMTIGVLFCGALLGLLTAGLPMHKRARRVYLVGGTSIFLGMSLFYSAAQLIPSGWVAVIFGVSPIATGILSAFVEPSARLTPSRMVGLLLGLGGLYLVFSAGLEVEDASLKGVVITLMGTLVSAASSVISRQLVKDLDISGMQITTGSLIVAIPFFAAAVILLEPNISVERSGRALASIAYLGLVGTGIGFTLYYYLLKRISASRISLIALITPITALSVGSWLNNEPLVSEVWLGAGLVCLGLLLYEFKPRLGLRKL